MAIVWDDEKTGGGSSIVWDNEKPASPPNPSSEMSWGDVAVNALANTPKSAIEYGKNILTPLIHPIDTLQGIEKIAEGAKTKLFGGQPDQNTASLDAFRSMLADRYGGYENIKRTIANDPVGALADASTVFTGGGSMAAKLPGIAGKVGQAAATAGRIAEPVNLVKRTVGAAANAAIPNSWPMRLYDSAVKPKAPSPKFTREQQIQTLQAGLDAGIMPTEKGVTKIDDIISGLNDQIVGTIDQGSKAGATIKTADVVTRLDGLNEFFGRLPDSEPYLTAIDKIKEGMLSKGATLPIAEAQKTKQAIYSVLKDSYGELSTATKEANKGIARGIKEEIVSIFPEIKSLNAQESIMLRLEPLISKAAGRIDKRDLLGIGTPIAGAAMGALGGPGAGAAMWITKAVMDHPSVKTYIAIALNKAKKGGMGPGFVEQRLAAYWAGKAANGED